MPRRTREDSYERNLRSNGILSDESDLDLPVANVNKANSRNSKEPKEKNKQKDKQKRKVNEGKILKQGESSTNKRKKKNEHCEANFVEDGHLIQMGVEEGEDDLSEDVITRSKGTDELEEGQISSSEDDDVSEKEVFFNMNHESHSNITEVQQGHDDASVAMERSRANRIKQINQEMKQRLIELKKLMQEEGLTESVELLDQMPQVQEQKNRDGGKPSQTAKKGGTDVFPINQTNVNTNANVNLAQSDMLQSKITGSFLNNCKSLETIYEAAVPQRDSTSSEEEMLINTSDESVNQECMGEKQHKDDDPMDKQIEVLIADGRRNAERHGRTTQVKSIAECQDVQPNGSAQPLLSTSRAPPPQMQSEMTTQERIQHMIKEAEKSKARIFATQGITPFETNINEYASPQLIHANGENNYPINQVTPTAVYDEGYIVVGAHLDETIVSKISRGNYVDFGKLLPRDRVSMEDDGRMEMYVKNGRTYWAPVSFSVSINSFARWEQAFRVYSNIYCKTNPHRAAELIEYNHIIHTVALAYVWDNVYTYDKEFRLHMARNPQQSWAMILQQAWSLRLRDRIMTGNTWANTNNNSFAAAPRGGSPKVNEPCRRFNRGRCNFGNTCKYEHRCSYCFKFGHSSVNCRKAVGDRERRNNDRGPNHNHSHAQGSAVVTQETSGDKVNQNQNNNKK